MGTKVHYKSYFPGHHSMRDLNEDASTGSWSPFYEDKMVRNGQYYNGFMPMSMDGYSEYDKEELKRTMLEHEAIFRNQVYELHRLYRIQRDLMSELQKKELYKYSMQMETSSFNPFSSLMPSGDIQKMWQMSSVSAMNSTYSRPSFSGTEDRRSLHFLKESKLQSDSSPTQNRVCINNSELLDSKVKNFQKRTFDLQLPADVYIDSEDGEGIEMEKTREMSLASLHCQSKNNGIEPVRDMNLSLGTAEKPRYRGDDKKMDSHLSSGRHAHCLADLNEPIKGIFNEEASASSCVDRLGPVVHHEEIQGQQLPTKQNLGVLSLSKDFFQDNQKCRDKRSLSNIIHSDNEYKREWPSYNLEAGQTSAFHHGKLPMSPEELLVDSKKPPELPKFLLSDQSRTATWFTGKAKGAETPKRNSGLTIHNLTEQMAPPTPSLLPAVSCTDDPNTGSSSVSSWRKPADSTTSVQLAEVQGLPWLNRSPPLNRQTKSFNSTFQSANSTKEKWDLNFSCISQLSSMSEMPCQNGLKYGFKPESNAPLLQLPLSGNNKLKLNDGDYSSCKDSDVHGPGKISKITQCMDVKSAKEMNLNLSHPNGFRDGIHSQGPILIDGERNEEDPFRGISWLRKKETSTEFVSVGGLTQKDLGFSPGCSQLLSSRVVDSQPFQVKIETEKGPSLCFIKDSLSDVHTKDEEARKIELAGCSSSKIFGVPVSPPMKDPSPRVSSSMSCQVQCNIADTENGVKNAVEFVDTFSKPALPNLEKKPFIEDQVSEKVCDGSSTGLREHINLNSVAIAVKEQPPESLEVSFKNDRAVPTLVPEPPAEFAVEIDLEAPVILSHIEDMPLESEALGINDTMNNVQSIQCEVDVSQDTLARLAAESILAMSTCVHRCSDDTSCHPSSPRGWDSLLWFSEVISSNADELESMVAALRERGDADNDSSEDAVDSFEIMTLQLTETKVEECNWKPWEKENQKKEEMGTPTLLTRPRKNQRRGRQRRDFQKDILPGLVSLSRHEVTEDLQTIGGLMKASGFSWQTGTTRRNAGRNGWNCRARGRRRPRGSAAAAGGGNWAGLLQKQSSNGEMEHEGGLNLQGWGKTTRRCRRQRFPTGNSSAALT